jgi:hypothetical protein
MRIDRTLWNHVTMENMQGCTFLSPAHKATTRNSNMAEVTTAPAFLTSKSRRFSCEQICDFTQQWVQGENQEHMQDA